MGPRSPGPLVGGIENGIDMILRSPLVPRHDLEFFNSYREPNSSRSWLERVRYQVGAFVDFIRCMMRSRPRLIHVKVADGINFLQGAGYAGLARLSGRPVFLQIHGGEFDSWYASSSTPGKFLIRSALRVPTAVLVLSDYWRDYVGRLAPGTPIHVVPNGVELGRVPPASRGDGTRVRVVTVGAIGARKGHFDIMQAAIRMGAKAPFVFLFVGSDEYGGETARLREEIGRHRLEKTVEFLGPLTGDAKWKVLAGADVFLLPAHNENMPNSILEAMAAGLPVVCTDVGAVRQMVGTAGALIVPTGDPNAIAAALEGLGRDPAGRRAMGDANRQRAVEEYSFDRVARDLDDLYERYSPRAPNGGRQEERVPSSLGQSEIPRTH